MAKQTITQGDFQQLGEVLSDSQEYVTEKANSFKNNRTLIVYLGSLKDYVGTLQKMYKGLG